MFQYIVDLAENFVAPERKELYFFTEHFQKGKIYYESKFPKKRGIGTVTGEATPDYLFYPHAPERLARYYPNAKIVIILRDPVLRAYSQYHFQNNTEKTQGKDNLPFSKAIEVEESRFTSYDVDNFTYSYKYHSYKSRGRYAEQIRRWMKYFPPEQMLILELGALNENPKETVEKLFNFLGLKFNYITQYSFKPSNTGPSKISPIDEKTKVRLNEYFKEYNKELFSLLDTEYDWYS